MVADTRANQLLRDVEGFRVESPEGELGWVEEIWVDEEREPHAVAIQTKNRRHALVLCEEVVAVHRDQRWIVVQPRAALRELAPPQLVTSGDNGSRGRIEASWATTGSVLTAPARRPRLSARRPTLRSARQEAPEIGRERPFWQVVALLYLSIAAFVGLVVAFAFVVAKLITGAAY
jgi:hypothetical protein